VQKGKTDTGNKEKCKETSSIYDFSKYNLNETDKKVLTLKLEGKPQIQICKELQKSEKHISLICNKPEFKKAYNEISTSIRKSYIQTLIDAKKTAADKLVEHIGSSNPVVSIRACEQILQLDKLDLVDNDKDDNSLEFKGFNAD
jgi:transcriptional regulator